MAPAPSSADEQNLSQTLIDPSNLDDPTPQWTKGEKQESKCRDAWAALLFYAQFIAIAVVAGWLGVPAIQDGSYNDASTTTGSGTDYTGLIYASLIAGGSSLVLSALSLSVMSACPKFLIQISLLFSLALSLLVVVVSFFYGNVVGGIFGIIFFLINVCYACAVWRRIPFAAANLTTGLTAVKRNAGSFVVAYLITLLMFGFTALWMTATVGVYDREGLCTTTATSTSDNGSSATSTTTTCNSGNLAWGYLFLLLLSLFWTQQVFQNTIHVVIAGVVSTWWFSPDEASSCCSVAIRDSFVRATTTSFGSICFGSLLVAIIQTLRAMVQSARRDDVDGCAAFLLCILDCLLRCIEDMLEYFNKFAYIYVGMYGYSYLEAGKNVMTLFNQKGWTIIISDNLVSNVLSLFCLVVGCLTGCVGLIVKEAEPLWFEAYGGSATGVAFGFSFLIGIVISAILLSVVDSSVNTVLVAFAEAPSEFEENHPQLSSDMREAWRQVYPAECGF